MLCFLLGAVVGVSEFFLTKRLLGVLLKKKTSCHTALYVLLKFLIYGVFAAAGVLIFFDRLLLLCGGLAAGMTGAAIIYMVYFFICIKRDDINDDSHNN